MSDNRDLLNDKDVCSFEEHEAENVCSNKDAVACGDGSSSVPTKNRMIISRLRLIWMRLMRQVLRRRLHTKKSRNGCRSTTDSM